MANVHDLIGGRATWTALGLPTEGVVGDRRRISTVVKPVPTVDVDGVTAAIDGDGPVAVLGPGGVLVGGLDGATVSGLPPDTPVRRAMVPAPGTIRPELRIEEVAQQLADDGLDRAFVTTVSGVLLGLVTSHGLSHG
jgi:hypothetical protein